MPRVKKYTKDGVIAILEQSEGRLSPVSHQPGHTLARHVLIGDLQLSDRLRATMPPPIPGRPILVDPSGQVVNKALHREIWKETNPGLNSKTANADFDRIFVGDSVPKAGAFADLQQAGVLGRFALNSTDGQGKLAELDAGTSQRVEIEYSVADLHNMQGEWKMRYVEKGNDIASMTTFTKVFLLVDRLDPDMIHIQTFFPMA
jgi:hypothetical protein